MTQSQVTWDEPENYFVGRVYLNQLTGLHIPQALPFRADTHWERYPPLAITIASAFSWIVAETLHLTPPIVAHHMAVVLFGALAALATYLIVLELTGRVETACTASMILFFSPVFFGHLHVNIKDIPQAALFTIAIYWALRYIKKQSVRTLIFAATFWGLGIATKLNTLFVPVIMGTWGVCLMHRSKITWKNGWLLFLYLGIGILTMVIVWPWVGRDPIGHVRQIVQYAREVGRGLPVLFDGNIYAAGMTVPWWYAPAMVAIQTPLVILFFTLIGIGTSFKNRWHCLPLMWLGVVFARYLYPGTIIYNGARHVMEVFPAVAILASFGVQWVFDTLSKAGMPMGITRWGIGILLALSLFIPIVRLHPYEAMYFNSLAGGESKASANFDFDYWGFSVGELVTKVNAIEPDLSKRVYIEWLNFPAAYFPKNKLTFVQTEAEHADYIIIPNSRNFFDGAIHYWMDHGKLVYTVTREGAIMGYVFRTHR